MPIWIKRLNPYNIAEARRDYLYEGRLMAFDDSSLFDFLRLYFYEHSYDYMFE